MREHLFVWMVLCITVGKIKIKRGREIPLFSRNRLNSQSFNFKVAVNCDYAVFCFVFFCWHDLQSYVSKLKKKTCDPNVKLADSPFFSDWNCCLFSFLFVFVAFSQLFIHRIWQMLNTFFFFIDLVKYDWWCVFKFAKHIWMKMAFGVKRSCTNKVSIV